MIFKIAKEKIGASNLITLLKIVPFAFALHELEEWNTLSWHQKNQSNIPAVTDIDLRTIFLFLILFVFLVFYSAIRLRSKKITSYILFPFLALLCYNGLVHFYWTLYFSDYSPGLIFGFLLGVPLMTVTMYKIVHENLVQWWYALAAGLLFSGLFIEVIRLEDKLEPGIVKAMLLGQKLAQWLWF